jgi:hypothetical protein
MEKRRAPAGYVHDGRMIAMENKEFPVDTQSRFPLWANDQFQRFGRELPGREGEIFLKELEAATARYGDLRGEKILLADPVWQERWRRNFDPLSGGMKPPEFEASGSVPPVAPESV